MSPLNTPSLASHYGGITHYPIFTGGILCALIVIGTWFSTSLAADDTPALTTPTQSSLAALLNDLDIRRLYEDLAETVLAESHLARQACDETVEEADHIKRFFNQWLGVDQLMDASVQQMSRHIDLPKIDEVADWVRSAPGQLILEAEAQSAEWSDDEFAQRALTLASDPDWNDARKKRILRVLNATNTVRFVTALHSESSALVLQASDCEASDVSYALLNQRVENGRADEALFSVFLRNDIFTTTAMIFSDISDADLDAYQAFSQSATGRAWNDALLTVIRQVLRDRHATMHDFLAAIPQ